MLQGGLIMDKSGRDGKWGTIFYGHDIIWSVFNHYDVIRPAKQSHSARKRKIRVITPLKVIQGHRCRHQSKACMRLPISD